MEARKATNMNQLAFRPETHSQKSLDLLRNWSLSGDIMLQLLAAVSPDVSWPRAPADLLPMLRAARDAAILTLGAL